MLSPSTLATITRARPAQAGFVRGTEHCHLCDCHLLALGLQLRRGKQGSRHPAAIQPHPEPQILGKMLSRHKVCVLLARFDLSRSSRFDLAAPTLAEP